jgi:hypothetical protein
MRKKRGDAGKKGGVKGRCKPANGIYGSKNKDNIKLKEIHSRCVSDNNT